jgi:hypothetical protein
MTLSVVAALLILALVALSIRKVFTRAGRRGVGTGAAGAYYDMLNKDQREAIEIVAEKRAERRDPEDRDGNLPDLTGRDSRRRNDETPR